MGALLDSRGRCNAGRIVLYHYYLAQGIPSAKGIHQRSAGGQDIAPGVVGVGDYHRTGGVQDGRHIPLQVRGVVIHGTVVSHRHGVSAGVVGEVQAVPGGLGVGVCSGERGHTHPAQLPAVIDIAVCL